MAAIGMAPQGVGRIFHQVTAGSPYMDALREIFEAILTPLYGSQEKALGQIALAKDRVCYLLYENNRPVGVIAFKTVLSDEFEAYGVTKSVEIKSLFVVESSQNSGRGVGTALWNEVAEKVRALHLNENSLHVTVSETKRESLLFFLKKGFQIKHAWYGKYSDNTLEYLLARSSRVEAIAKEALGLQSKQFVQQAHWDAIHGLVKLSDGTFVSGSKDHSLYKWNGEGSLLRVVREVEPTEHDTKDWITALSVLNDAYWVSAERSGRTCLWTTEGRYVKALPLKLPKGDHVSQKENQTRVNCIVPSADPSQPGFFVGFPTRFSEYNAIEGRTVASTKVHANDWVYCMHSLQPAKLLIVVGAAIDLWGKTAAAWRKEATIVAEGPKKRRQRDFISCLTPLEAPQFAFGSFYGSVKVLDLTQKQVVKEMRAHQGKTWALATLSPRTFASGGEDEMVRLWDVRTDRAEQELKSPGGAISTLLRFNDNLLIAASCPKNPIQQGGASLTFYDIRK